MFIKLSVFIILQGLIYVDSCPPRCSCKPLQADLIKVTCEDKIREIREIDFSSVTSELLNLDLSRNEISDIRISMFKNFTNLKRLNLSFNNITLIDEGAFDGLINLESLDLSKNQITTINSRAFQKLQNLKRLKINGNRLEILREGIFHNLPALKTLDAFSNPWNCDCNLYWFSEWIQNTSIKSNPTPKCEFPLSTRGKLVKKLRFLIETECRQSMPTIEILPNQDQVVFAGDPITLKCRAPSILKDKNVKLNWLWNSNVTADIVDLSMYNNVQNYFNDIGVENQHLKDTGTLSSLLNIDPVKEEHNGKWNCFLESLDGNISRSINIIVISNSTQYCPLSVTKNNKGVYAWPRTVIGWSVELPCDGNGSTNDLNQFSPKATYKCNDTGYWIDLNTDSCPYISTTTRILEQFAKINITLTNTLIETIKKLKNITENGSGLTDPVEIEFVAQAIENNAKYLVAERELGPMLIDIVNVLLNLSKPLLKAAEINYRSCTRLLKTIELIVENTPPTQLLQVHKKNMALEQYRIKPELFDGLICNWYSNSENDRLLSCSLNNSTNIIQISNSATTIEASIQIPATLFKNITSNVDYKLMISMYSDNKLFPKTNNLDNKDVTSSIVGSKIVGTPMHILREPIYVMLKVPYFHFEERHFPKPAVWDPLMNNISGGWSTDGCHISNFYNNYIFFHCNRLGYYGLLQDKSYYLDSRSNTGAEFKYSNPAIYIGSFILLACLMCSVVTYICCYAAIAMPKKAKHCIMNTWVAMSLLVFLYTFGIQQTEDIEICQIVGIGIHYLSLCTLFWMAVSANNMYKRLSKSTAVDPITDDDELHEPPVKKPILGIYLVGWGISMIICGIFGAISLRDYAGYLYCFLNTIPSLASIFVPASIIVLYLIIIHMLIRCTIRNVDLNGQLSEGTQATENVDLELLEPNINPVSDRISLHSSQAVSSEVEDQEHSLMTQLKGLIIVMILYLLSWSCAAMTTANLLSDYIPYEETIFAALYAICSSSLGMFILLFYGIARSDVRAQWLKMRCWLRKKKNQCCRNRGVSDTNPPIPTQPLVPTLVTTPNLTVQTVHITADNNSISSSKFTHKSHSSCNTSKHTNDLGRCFVKPNHVINSSLLTAHRQQYRSNNSVITYNTESAPASVEIFYNPHQSGVARKFFKKQRRHMKNNVRKHRDGAMTSDGGSCISVPRRPMKLRNDIGRNILCSNVKVNNTNIHVELNPVNDLKNVNVLSDSGGSVSDDRNFARHYVINEENIKIDNRAFKNEFSLNAADSCIAYDSVMNITSCATPYESDNNEPESIQDNQSEHSSQQCDLEYTLDVKSISSIKSDHFANNTPKVSSAKSLTDVATRRSSVDETSFCRKLRDFAPLKTQQCNSLSSLPQTTNSLHLLTVKSHWNSFADTTSLNKQSNRSTEIIARPAFLSGSSVSSLDTYEKEVDKSVIGDSSDTDFKCSETAQLHSFGNKNESDSLLSEDQSCQNSINNSSPVINEDSQNIDVMNVKKETSV